MSEHANDRKKSEDHDAGSSSAGGTDEPREAGAPDDEGTADPVAEDEAEEAPSPGIPLSREEMRRIKEDAAQPLSPPLEKENSDGTERGSSE